MSKIEWTERTWNPILGCDKVSPGCKNCYAIRMAWRLQHNPLMADRYKGLTTKTEGGNINWTGTLRMVPAVLHLPLDVKKPTTWFVNSMSDLFHESLTFGMIDEVFDVMDACPQHTFQILTKRPSRMLEYFHWKHEGNGTKFGRLPLANVWLGTSIEDQERGNERLKALLNTPAVVRFVSCEPLLGPLSLGLCLATEVTDLIKDVLHNTLHWVIVGGESGPKARPMHPDWARNLRNECTHIGIHFFFKQWGEWKPFKYVNLKGEAYVNLTPSGKNEILLNPDCQPGLFPASINMERVGKKKAGRLLDGMEWNEMPE
jgi:protein gp37